MSDVAPLTPEMVLTQYGKRGEPFRNRLRLQWAEAEMSLILGRQTALVAALLVTRTVVPLAAVRYTTVGRLSGEGFQVRHSPTRGNPLHVSVACHRANTGRWTGTTMWRRRLTNASLTATGEETDE